MLSTLPASQLTLAKGAGDSPALISPTGILTYAELASMIARRREDLGSVRRLVMVQASNAVEPVVTYLAALEEGHPVLLVAAGDDEASVRQRASLAERFDPDVIAGDGDSAPVLHEVRTGTVHEFGPDLAVLVSTSGSTGSQKLVRLSRENVRSNAYAIAEYLTLTPADRAATSLPMHYCYGLSVINSHLVSGASVLLTSRSVTDAGFWEDAEAYRITSLAGVPYTYELLEAGGVTERMPTSIRYLTQAGGRLAPEAVRRFARLGQKRGFEFFVMYGQTEATARMAYVSPQLVEHAAETIGRAIPGGRLRIDAEPGAEVGELVYEGPNVMLGYAETPADLALGRTVFELRTGDLARQRADGLFEIVGRMNRFVKVYGLRVDLDGVQRLLADSGIEARAAGSHERLLVFVKHDRDVTTARDRAAALLGLPVHAVRVYPVAQFPCTASGKPDFVALVRYASQLEGQMDGAEVDGEPPETAEAIRNLYVELLGMPEATVDDSFAGLGGDSLSYVEVSLRLEELLGRLPRDWPSQSATKLAETAEPEVRPEIRPDGSPERSARAAERTERRRTHFARVETPAILRAAAIMLIVATHADLINLKGGAHLLLGVAGYNLARFQLADAPGTTRVRHILRSAAQIVVPAMLWIGAVGLISGKYTWTTAALLNNFVPGDGRWNEQWQFWFLEAAVWAMVGIAALFAIRPVDRFERRNPWTFAVVLLLLALGARLALSGIEAHGVERYSIAAVLCFLALGWVIARADTVWKRVAVTAATVVTTAGFFGEPVREAVVIAGMIVLIWLPQVRMPRLAITLVRVLAGASLFIYLTHWVVYPPWEDTAPWLGTTLSLVVGALAWWVYRWGVAGFVALRSRLQASGSLQASG